MKILNVAVLLVSTLASAQNYAIDATRSNAQFDIKNMLVSSVHGVFPKVTGTAVIDDATPANSKISATIDVSTISTGSEKRDIHLKTPDYFDLAQYPSMTFVSSSAKKTADGQFEIAGALTIHGVTKPLTLLVTLKGTAAERHATASTVINRKEYGITQGGPMMGDEAKVTLDIMLVQAG